MCGWKRKGEFIEFIGNTVTEECDGEAVDPLRDRPGWGNFTGSVLITSTVLPPRVISPRAYDKRVNSPHEKELSDDFLL